MLLLAAALALSAVSDRPACLDHSERATAYVLQSGEGRSVCGGNDDLARAVEALDGDGLWIRIDGREWVIGDPVDLREAAARLAVRSRLASTLGAISGKQAEAAAERAALDAERVRQEDKRIRYAARRGDVGAAEKEIAVGARLEEIGLGLTRLDARLRALEDMRSEATAELGRAEDDARLGLSLLVERALRHGTATPVSR